jgi:hypothetical protein
MPRISTFRFTLRDVFWFTLLTGLLLTWWREGVNLDSEKRSLEAEIRQATSERDAASRRLRMNESFYVADGWHTLADPEHYEIGLDYEVRHSGRSSAYIKAISAFPKYYAAIVQSVRADQYSGKRVQLSAYIKTEVADYTFLFLQFSKWSQNSSTSNDHSVFNSGSDQIIRGTVDWKRYDIVFDVPLDADHLAFGVIARDGSTWLDDLKLEVVEPNIPTTRVTISRAPPVMQPRLPKNFPLPAKPLSLHFDD